MPGPHVFCDFRWYDSSEKGIDGSRSSVDFTVICIESITSLCWGGSSQAAIPGVCMFGSCAGQCSHKIHVVVVGGSRGLRS